MKVSGLISKAPQVDPNVVRSMRSQVAVFSGGIGGIGNKEITEDTIIRIPLSQITRSPYQVRTMGSQEKVEELAKSIQENGQSTPIIVRPIPCRGGQLPAEFNKETDLAVYVDGKPCTQFELIAGEHRVRACRLLDQKDISAVVRLVDDGQAAIFVTTDNAHNHPLSDYDRYLHAKMLEEMNFCKTDAQAMVIVGVKNRTSMSQIMSFRNLPEGGHKILAEHHGILASNAMYRIKEFCASHPEEVVAAIAKLAEGKLTQSQLPSFIDLQIKKKEGITPKRQAAQKVMIKRSGMPDIQIRCTDKEARIECQNIDASRLAKLVEENLEFLLVGEDLESQE